ncbi:MAG: SapC family protein [Pseudomonadales bacterium]
MTQMLFYKDPKPLSPAIHGALRVRQTPQRFGFAKRVNSVLCAGVEFAEIAHEYPIVFAEGDREWVPIVLFGLKAGENRWVDDRDAWLGQYVPAFVRQYPFAIGRGESEQPLVCVDDSSEMLSVEEGTPLFEAGQPSPLVKQTAEFLREFHQQMERTKQFTAKLASLGLLAEVKASVNGADHATMSLGKARVVDERKLLELEDEQALALFKKGELAWVYAHLLSLGHLRRLLTKQLQATA